VTALRDKLRRFARLPAADQRVLVGSAVLLPVAWLALRTLGLRRLERRMHGLPGAHESKATFAEVQNWGSLVNLAARHHPLPMTCLTRSIFLLWLMRRRGVDGQLRIGVRLDQGFSAHAWVELDGEPVNDAPDVARHFAVMPGLSLGPQHTLSR
jgi:hypothetical protein